MSQKNYGLSMGFVDFYYLSDKLTIQLAGKDAGYFTPLCKKCNPKRESFFESL
jgi:hypothetical protein